MAKRFILLALLFPALLGCIHKERQSIDLERREFAELPGWADNKTFLASFSAFNESCKKLNPADKEVEIKTGFGKKKYWLKNCEAAGKIKADDAKKIKEFFEKNFLPFLVTKSGDAGGLFTGYYVPEIAVSKTRRGNFVYPIYRKPDEDGLNYSRKQIDEGALAGRNLELLYTNDPVQLFFLHIQGSGIARFGPDEKMLIGFAGKNHYPYHAVGADLLKENELEAPVTAAKIKGWLYKHPERQKEILEKNPSYIFFKEMFEDKVRGSSGAALTPGYSLAIDNSWLPFGAPLWLDTRMPDKTPLQRLMIAEDSGSGVKGAVRGDIFFGEGPAAEKLAGEMQSPGKYYILLPAEMFK